MENPVDSDIFQFAEGDESPFCVLTITAENSKTEKDILAVVFCDEPFTPLS
jgi:hypothetical protein